MSPFSGVALLWYGYCLRIVLLLLLLAALYVCITALMHGRRRAYTVATALHLLVLIVLFISFADGAYHPVHLPPRTAYPGIVSFVYGVPWGVYVLLECVSACALADCFYRNERFKRSSPSFDSVKEAVDDLPVGACFIAENGAVALTNLRMNEWCRALTGQPLVGGDAFLRGIQAAGEQRSGQTLLRLSESCVLLLSETWVNVNGKRYRQLTAADVTEQFRVTAELEEKNAKLKDINLRMKAYSVDLTELVMRREQLSARVAVHDGVGHAILRAKHYLEHPSAAAANEVLALLRQTNAVLLGAPEDERQHDPVEFAVQLARGIGVRVAQHGDAPQAAEIRALVGRAIRECAMNAVKHADGSELRVSYAETGEGVAVTLVSNGSPAAGEVTLAGGLRSLREAAAALGGNMRVHPQPAFTVTLTLPK